MRFVLGAGIIACLCGVALVQARPGKPTGQNDDAKKNVSFKNDVYPIIEKRCLQCHCGEPNKTKGGLDMSNFDKFIKGGQRGSPIVVGKAAESLIVKLLDRSEKPNMPPSTEEPATIEELLLIERWINQGAKK